MRYWIALFKEKGFLGQYAHVIAPTRRKAISAMRHKYQLGITWKLESLEEITESEYKTRYGE